MAWRIVKNYSDHDAAVLCCDEDDDSDSGAGLAIRPWFKKPEGTEAQVKLFVAASETAWRELAATQVQRRATAEQQLAEVKTEAVSEEVLAAAPARRRRQRTQRADASPLPLPLPPPEVPAEGGATEDIKPAANSEDASGTSAE